MTHVNLVKLCVGADGVDDLLSWQEAHFGTGDALHITRMWPKREEEVLAGGSLYWVFRGLILARQRIAGLDRHQGADGIARCAIRLDRKVILTEPAPRRPFQGWRYLDPKDSPRDLPEGRPREEALPPSLAAALADIGLR